MVAHIATKLCCLYFSELKMLPLKHGNIGTDTKVIGQPRLVAVIQVLSKFQNDS